MLTLVPGISFSQYIKLTWDKNPEKNIAYYAIYRSTANFSKKLIFLSPGTTTVYNDSDIIIGKEYYYRITAIDSFGNESEFSNEEACFADMVANVTQAINIKSFQANAKENDVKILFRIPAKTNFYQVIIERKEELSHYKSIAKISPNQSDNNYVYSDKDLYPGKYAYRLKIYTSNNILYSQAISIELSTPAQFVLDQNYPNPFNMETAIRFEMPLAGKVNITIYDILGRKIKCLADGSFGKGSHQVIWRGKDDLNKVVATGVYFLIFRSKDFSRRIRMTAMK